MLVLQNNVVKVKGGGVGNYIETITVYLVWCVPWGKLYKQDILEKYSIRFDNRICSGEDSVFVLEYVKFIRSVWVKKPCGYCYAENNGLSKKKLTLYEIDLILEMLINGLESLEKKYSIRLKAWKINFIWNFVTKYKIPRGFKTLYNDMKFLSKKYYMQQLVCDYEIVPKGIFRHFFDFLYRRKLCLLLSCLIFITKRFYD